MKLSQVRSESLTKCVRERRWRGLWRVECAVARGEGQLVGGRHADEHLLPCATVHQALRHQKRVRICFSNLFSVPEWTRFFTTWLQCSWFLYKRFLLFWYDSSYSVTVNCIDYLRRRLYKIKQVKKLSLCHCFPPEKHPVSLKMLNSFFFFFVFFWKMLKSVLDKVQWSVLRMFHVVDYHATLLNIGGLNLKAYGQLRLWEPSHYVLLMEIDLWY